jgi:hypothetical protein
MYVHVYIYMKIYIDMYMYIYIYINPCVIHMKSMSLGFVHLGTTVGLFIQRTPRSLDLQKCWPNMSLVSQKKTTSQYTAWNFLFFRTPNDVSLVWSKSLTLHVQWLPQSSGHIWKKKTCACHIAIFWIPIFWLSIAIYMTTGTLMSRSNPPVDLEKWPQILRSELNFCCPVTAQCQKS